MKPINPLQLQRLVDGELDEKQLQSVLGEAESSSEQWREIAVGYIENQLWIRACQSAESVEMPLVAQEADPNAVVATDQSLASYSKKSTDDRSGRGGSSGFRFSWFVMAASLLVAATIGYMADQINNRTIPPNPLADSRSAEPDAPSLPAGALAYRGSAKTDDSLESTRTPRITQADYHLEVPEDSEHFQDVVTDGAPTSVPLYKIENRSQLEQLNQRRRDPVLPAALLERLANSGYRAEQHIEYISGRLENGQSFVVPVRTIRFIPGQ